MRSNQTRQEVSLLCSLDIFTHSVCALQHAVLLHNGGLFGLCRWHVLAGVGDRAGVFAASDAASGCFVYQSRQLAEAWLLAGCMQSTTVDAFMHHPSRVSAAAQRCDRVSSADGVTLGIKQPNLTDPLGIGSLGWLLQPLQYESASPH